MVYSDGIEDKIDFIIEELKKKYPDLTNYRWHAIKLLEQDKEITERYPVNLPDVIDRNYESDIINEKNDFIQEIIKEVLVNKDRQDALTEKADRALTHRFWSIPIFLGIMAVVFFLTFTIGDWLKGYLEVGIESFSGAVSDGLVAIGVNEMLRSLLVDGIIAGVGGILTFLPNIFILFLALAFLEDSGYMALRFEETGIRRLHMVDLDGAKAAQPRNLAVLERIASKTALEVQYGGGIKSTEALRSVFDAGARRAICGSVAVRRPELFAGWLAEFGPGKLILGADIRDGKAAVQGWTEASELSAQELIAQFAPQGLAQVICTDIARDGMLCGASAEFYAALQGEFPGVEITVSGGIGSMADIEALDGAGLRSVIVGKALYEERITLEELKRCLQNA